MSAAPEANAPDIVPLQGDRRLFVLDRLGRGRAGAVHEGLIVDGEGARRPVAVKIFDARAAADRARLAARVAGSAELAMRFSHPAAVALLDTSLDAASPHPPLVVMERAFGVTLEAVLGRRAPGVRLPFDLGVAVALRVSDALAAALKLGLVHGGVAPSEVHVTPAGEIKLGGFGTDPGHAAGSSEIRAFDVHDGRVTTLAPELVDGGRADARSDVFALGVVVHELLVAPRFGHVASRAQAMQLLRDGLVPEPIFAAQAVPAPVRRILRRATAANPGERFATAGEMRIELERIARPLGATDDPTVVRRAMRDALRAVAETSDAPISA